MFEKNLDDWLNEYEQDSEDLLGILKDIMSIDIKPETFSLPAGAQISVSVGQEMPSGEDRTFRLTDIPENYLMITLGQQQGRKIPVDRPTVFGRSGSADIAIEDKLVSRRHMQIQPVVGGFQITDLGSSNGTKVNGQLISGSVMVTPGDQITLGETVLEVMGQSFEAHQATKLQKFCTKCGQPLKAGKKFCVNCGAVID